MRNQGRHSLILLVTALLTLLCVACNREETPVEELVTFEPEEEGMTTSDLEPMDTELAPMGTELGDIEPTLTDDDDGSTYEPSPVRTVVGQCTCQYLAGSPPPTTCDDPRCGPVVY